MQLSLRLVAPFAGAFLAATASAQTIVNTGDDLVAIVAAASSGDVIQIHSDDVFVGLLNWTGKDLTFEAGPGYSPTLRGPDGNNCLQPTSGNPPTIGTFRGLRIEGGIPAPFEAFPLVAHAGSGADKLTKLGFEDCTFGGRPTFGGYGDSKVQAQFQDCVFEDNFLAYGIKTAPLELLLEDCVVTEVFQALCSTIPLGGVQQADITLRRSLFGRGIELNASSGGALTVLAESCVVDGDLEPGTSVPYGVRVFADVVGSFSNLTVTGVTTGLQGQPGVTWHNLLIAGTFGASLSGVDVANISNSLIEDGTFDGLNGNFTASAHWDADYQLLSCSAGFDVGDGAAPGLTGLDFNGKPRVQDNDAIPGAAINVGATEKTGTISAAAVVENGSGVNPTSYVAGTLPTLGGTFDALILNPPGPSPVLTVIIADAAAPPTTSPLWTGELMLALSGAAIYDYAPGAFHSMAVPSGCGLAGLVVPTQGFSVFDESGVLVPKCHNRLDLTLGS